MAARVATCLEVAVELADTAPPVRARAPTCLEVAVAEAVIEEPVAAKVA